MMKSLMLIAPALLLSGSAFAFLPVASVTTMSLPVYGVYTTSDPACVTGFSATVPLSTTPQTINFAASPAIGTGPVPATIGCAIFVIGNNLSNGWAAGNYTSTSSGDGGGGPYPDSNCNSGGSSTGQSICHGINPTWPARIVTDAAAIGLTLVTGTCAGTTSEVVPLVLSTHSVCTGQTAADAAVPACAGGNINNFALPTSSADATNGTKLTAPSVEGDLKFVINPANTLGGQSGNKCDNIKAPLFSFVAK
jgi:hypothetical protein